MRAGRTFTHQQPLLIAGPADARADLTIAIDSVAAPSFGQVGALSTLEQSGGAGDTNHTELLAGVSSIGTVGALAVSLEQGPEPTIVVLTGQRSTGQVGDLTATGNTELGWVKTEVTLVSWRRVEDFRYPASNPTGDIDFAPIISNFGTWKISTITESTVPLRSEASISDDTTVEGKP